MLTVQRNSAVAVAAAAPFAQEDSLFHASVQTKMRTAGAIARIALDAVLSHCEPGASIYALCKAGDDLIAAQLNAASAEALGLSEAQIAAAGSVEGARAALKRGSSFPVCVSVNEMFGFVSPSSDCADVLKAGDLVKVELGVHIDGYPAIVGETRVVGEPPADEARMQALAAVSNAAYIAAHCIMRMLRPGVKNTDITYLVGHVADHFGVKTIKNLLSYEIKRYVSDGRNQIQMSHPKPGDEAPESGVFEIMPGQSFCIDVRFSSGTGLVKQGTESTQVFKRRVDQFSQMRTEMGAKAYRDVNQHFPTFHFALRQLKDQQTAKAGVRQMFEHHMVEPFETLRDKSKHALIACARFSAMVLDQRTVITTPLPLPVLDGIALPLGVPELLARDAEAHEAFSPMSVLPKPVEDMAED